MIDEESNYKTEDVHYYDNPLDRYLADADSARKESSWEDEGYVSNLSTLTRVKEVLRAAERSLESMSSAVTVDNSDKTVRLREPLYFDDDFDPSAYVKELVDARFNGYRIEQQCRLSDIACVFEHRDIRVENQKMEPESDSGRRPAETGSNSKIIEVNKTVSDDGVKFRGAKKLSFHVMPGISIRSQLTEQKFPPLDIQPSGEDNVKRSNSNIVVLKAVHGENVQEQKVTDVETDPKDYPTNETAHEGNDTEETNESIQDVIKETEQPCTSNTKQYLFLDGTELKTDFLRLNKKQYSRLKKFGLPEISKIYAPKPTFVTKRSAHVQNYNKYLQTNYSCSSSSRHTGRSSGSFQPSEVFYTTASRFGSEISHSSSEYVPYSKLTIGGLKPKDAEKYVRNSIKKVKFDTTLTSNGGSSERNEDDKKDVSNEYGESFESQETSSDQEDRASTEKDEDVGTKLNTQDNSIIANKDTKATSTQMYDIKYKSTQTSPDKYPSPSGENITKIDINRITIGDMIQLEKTLSSFGTKLRLNKNVQENLSHDVIQTKEPLLAKDTQTSPVISTVETIDRPVSPVFRNETADAYTEPMMSTRNLIPDDADPASHRTTDEDASERPTCSKRSTTNKQKKVLRIKTPVTSDTYTDVSRSETSEPCSIGEINFTVLKKRIVTISKHHSSSSNTLSTSTYSDVHMDSTVSTQKSEGELK